MASMTNNERQILVLDERLEGKGFRLQVNVAAPHVWDCQHGVKEDEVGAVENTGRIGTMISAILCSSASPRLNLPLRVSSLTIVLQARGHDMVEVKFTGDALWARIERAVEIVKERMRRVSTALNDAEIPYAIIGGNAVQHWVAQVDESVVRNTRDVDIILNRVDLPRATVALEKVGFIYRHAASVSMFLDGPDAKARDAVHVLFAGEKVREDYLEPVPMIDKFEPMQDARTLPLESLVRMKLTSFRDKDKVHIRDMISIGMIDVTWIGCFSPQLGERLQSLLDDPDG